MVQRVTQVDEKTLMLQHRWDQARERADDFETPHNENPDLTNDNYAGLFGKALIHDAGTKLPEENEISKLKWALTFGEQTNFDALKRGGSRKLVDPQAALSYEMSGGGPVCSTMPACPTMVSGQAASEMIEVYEKALLRDVPFYEIELLTGASLGGINRAINTLRNYGSTFKGPKVSNQVTSKTLFRGTAKGCTVGPYVSQLLLRDVPIGAHTVQQKYNYEQGVYGITETNWYEIQKGNVPAAQQAPLGTTKYIHNGRSLGSFVHVDFVYQTYYYALAILLGAGARLNSGLGQTANEDAFATLGGPVELASGVAEVARHAIRSAWVQKWRYNLRLRPEDMAYRVHLQESNPSLGYVDSSFYSVGAATLSAVKAYNASKGGQSKVFLPLQYAEGSPTHPSYPAGHAVLSGACATYLKIMLDDAMLWSELTSLPVVESRNGDTLVSYAGDTTGMTVGTELNKLAANISIGRNIAGVHYRADGDEGMLLGEKVAIKYVKDQLSTYNGTKPTLSLTKFDGSVITI